MSTSQLATRLGVTRQAVTDLERREADDTITLSALQRTARAMGCELYYAVVPRPSLADLVRARARQVAERRLKGIAHSMNLEDQTVPDEEFERQVEDLADQLVRDWPRDLWAEPTT